MNAADILMYGHLWVHKHLDGLTEEQMEAPDVCGWWSVKDIVGHLASFEWVLADVLIGFVDPRLTPMLNQFTSMDGDSFNAEQVGSRHKKPLAEVLDEYNQGYETVRSLIPRLDAETLRQPGTLPWYGEEYSVEDLIVYQYYGHKREHMAQVAVYRDKLKGSG